MREEKFWQEGMDGKRFALCLFKKAWIILAAALTGAAAAVGIYLFAALALGGKPEYQVFSQYRIYFDKEKYGEIEDYYNAYTWGEIMKTDQVVDFVMEALPEGISKAQVKASVSVGQMNDVKIMPLYITTQDAGLSQEIAEAYVYGLDRFAKSIEGLSGMQCWTVEPAVQVPRATKTVNAIIFGGILGAVLSFLVLIFFYILDDSIYLEEDFAKRFPIPVLGLLTRGKDADYLEELKGNVAFLLNGSKRICLVDGGCLKQTGRIEKSGQTEKTGQTEITGQMEKTGRETGPGADSRASAVLPSCREAGELLSAAAGENVEILVTAWPFGEKEVRMLHSADSVVLAVPCGFGNGRALFHLEAQLEKLGITAAGAVLTDADDKFLRAYYGKQKRKASGKRK
ncbi:hypothetical protein [Eisenbergiella sp.]